MSIDSPSRSGALVVMDQPGYTAPLPPAEHESRARVRRGLLWTWVLLVVLYFSWESAAYRGLYSIIAEWQFDHIGQDLPTFTFGVLTTLFAWPALSLFRRRRRDALTPPGEDAGAAEIAAYEAEQERHDRDSAVDAARDYMHFLYGFAVALGFAAIVALLWTLALPRLSGHTHEVAIAGAEPDEGPAQLVGTVGYGRIASFSRGILFLRRSELYAPILPPNGARSDIRYFVEFSPNERDMIHSGASLTRRTGILVRNDLPGALLRLYRYLGYYPAKRYYVLYASNTTIRFPFYVIAGQFAIGGLAFLIAGLFQRRHWRRRAKDFDERYRTYDAGRVSESTVR